jgi:transposase-like protein
VKIVAPAAHESIKTAVSKVLNATWQRCRVHLVRNERKFKIIADGHSAGVERSHDTGKMA